MPKESLRHSKASAPAGRRRLRTDRITCSNSALRASPLNAACPAAALATVPVCVAVSLAKVRPSEAAELAAAAASDGARPIRSAPKLHAIAG